MPVFDRWFQPEVVQNTIASSVLENWKEGSQWRQALADDPDRPEEICICPCHERPEIVHCKPCCMLCSNCHLPIKDKFLADHNTRCGQYLGPQIDIVEINGYQQ